VKNEDDYTEFDEVNDLLVIPEPPQPSTEGKHELFKLYDQDDKLLYITRSSQLHKLKGRPFWPIVTSIKVERYVTAGNAEDAKIKAIGEESPAFNVRTTF
jgi:hypothetical protein